MRIRPRSAAALFVVMLLSIPAFPQAGGGGTRASAPTVTVSVTASGVRFVAHGAVSRMRVELLGADGAPLGTAAFKPGNVFDWTPDGVAAPLADGDYQLVVTVVDAAGRPSLKRCAVALRGGEASLVLGEAEPAGGAEIESAPHAQAEPAQAAMTFTAHDGSEGQLVTTSGDLSFRGGDFFTGRDKELMRLSRDGSLTVTGALLARGGIRFADGTVLDSARGVARAGKGERVGALAPGDGGAVSPSATVGRLAKFSTAGGAVVDSNVSEDASGNVGVGGAASSANRLNITSPHGVVPFGFTQNTSATTNPTLAVFSTADGVIGQYAGTTHSGAVSFVMGATTGRNFGLFSNNSFSAPQLFIRSTGNVGIGTNAPQQRLDVNGGARFTPGGSGGAIQFGTPNGETGMSISGGSGGRADLRFDGSTFKMAAVGPGLVPPSTFGLAVTTDGNVGVGTDVPSIGKLHVVGGPGQPAIYGESANRGVWGRSTGSSRGVVGESVSGEGVLGTSTSGAGVAGGSTSSIGVRGETASGNVASPGVQGVSTGGGVGVRGDGLTGVYGVSTTGGGVGVTGEANAGGGRGVYGTSTSATGYGVFANNPTGMALGVDGNAAQKLDKGGLVKAMIVVKSDGTVARCYNSQMQDGGVSLPPSGSTGCGFTVTQRFVREGISSTGIDLGFPVENRFWSGTIVSSLENVGIKVFGHSTFLTVGIFLTDERTSTDVFREFIVIVY